MWNDLFIWMRSEMILTGIILLLLLIKISGRMSASGILALVPWLLLLNFLAGFFDTGEGSLFGGMFVTKGLIPLQKTILNGGAYLISLIFQGWYRQNRHPEEFFILMLSSLLGMFFMISSNHLLLFYVSLELATLPLAALVNFDTHKSRSSEAAMKMIYNSAFSSGILLFGISLIYGITGTLRFDELAVVVQSGTPLMITAFIFLITSFAFKLSVVPFHFWTADVYEGAPAPVTAFLSVLSKGTAAFVFITVLYGMFGHLNDIGYYLLVILAMATMLIGNLFALRQQNMKRFLAFSSVAQVGFILAGVSAYATDGPASVSYFIIIYVFSNLAAFGVVDVMASSLGVERVDDYRGLYRNNPLLSWILAIALFSLAGIPPTAGFFGKFFLLSAAGTRGNYFFLAFAAINMIISLYYYLRVVRAVFIDKTDSPPEKINLHPAVQLGLILCTLGILLTGFMSWLYDHIRMLS